MEYKTKRQDKNIVEILSNFVIKISGVFKIISRRDQIQIRIKKWIIKQKPLKHKLFVEDETYNLLIKSIA